jgi:hypothetical protein
LRKRAEEGKTLCSRQISARQTTGGDSDLVGLDPVADRKFPEGRFAVTV